MAAHKGKSKEQLLKEAEDMRRRADALVNKANAMYALPAVPNPIVWPGIGENTSMRIPALMREYIDAIAAAHSIKPAVLIRRMMDIGLEAVRQGLPEDVRKETDKIRERV